MKPRINLLLAITLFATLALAVPGRFLEKCKQPAHHNGCSKTFGCCLTKGHEGSHKVPDHGCTRTRSCNSCSKTVECQLNCGHNSSHTPVMPHDCKRWARCTRYGCYFEEQCAYGNCGHTTHFVGGHRCRRPADCPNCNYSRCKENCGHSGQHKVGKHRCAVRGKCFSCTTTLQCINENCGHGVFHTAACSICHKLVNLKVD